MANQTAPRRLTVKELETRTLLSSGGGFTGGGLVGQYFTNATLSGTPIFTRTDVRVDFDWNTGTGAAASATGSTAYPLAATNFSVRWTGEVIPKYSQSYKFTTTTDGGVRLYVNGQLLINNWTLHTLATNTGSIALKAGKSYSIEMDYQEGPSVTGQAHLAWSGTNTPQEIIDPAAPLGINLEGLADWDGLIPWANAMHNSRQFGSVWTPWDQNAPVDANGWPTQDFGSVVLDSPGGIPNGTYALSFTGQAQNFFPVYCSATITDVNYDAASNTTTAQLTISSQTQLMLSFTGTQRTASSPLNSGLTNIQLMIPMTPGSSTSYASNIVFNTAGEQLISNFTAIRFMDYLATNANPQVNWSDRTPPAYAQYTVTQSYEGGGPWEYAVMLANETGKDMWINIPEGATDAYVTDVANLIRYGSDGTNPYTAPQANPVFPGLDSNLKVYVEYSNELWNYAFSQATQNYNDAVAEVNNGNSPLNYDGNTDPYTWAERRVGEREVQISNLFRGVFGDAQMMTRIRPLLEWQAGDTYYTVAPVLNFLNNYYNNADGQDHVAVPHPVNYFLWGGGGGWYFSVNNDSGQGDVTVPNGSFETPTITGYQADPTGTTWTFMGPAGIAANGSSLNNPNAPDGTQAAYIQGSGSFSESVTFTGGQADLSFYAAEGSSGSESFQIYYDNTLVTPNSSSSDWTPGQTIYALYHSLSFPTTAGTHTIKFVGESGNGTAFVDDVQVDTANAMYHSGLADPYPTLTTDAQWAHAFGLHLTNYEGGFTVGDFPGTTDLQLQANLDPRAQQLEAQGIARTFQAGSDLAMVFTSSGSSIWSLADPNIYDQNTPKLAAIYQVMGQLPAAPTSGTNLPTVVGQAASIVEDTNRLWPGPVLQRIYLLEAAVPGIYRVTFTGDQSDVGSPEHFTIDGQLVPGATSLPYAAYGPDNSSPALTFAISTRGLHALGLYVDGPQSILLDGGNVTITLVSKTIKALPTGWADSNIGAPHLAGQAVSYDGTNWTVSGGGAGITGVSDQFNLASRSWTGDGSVSAQVMSLTNTSAAATAGVLFRNGTSAKAAFAAVFLTPGNGVVFEYRSTSGKPAGQVSVAGVAAPQWVKLVRIGNTFQAFYSVDGIGWNEVGTAQTIVMSSTIKAGLTVSAANNSKITTANFDQVSVTSSTATLLQLTAFDFAGTDGTEATENPAVTAANVTGGAISRGPGLVGNNYGYPQVFGNSMASVPSNSVGNIYGTDLNSAIANGQYYQFTMTAASGHTLSLTSLGFAAWAQNGEWTFGAGLQYSTDGVNFTTVALRGNLGGASPGAPQFAQADLSGIAGLQNVSGTITFRIYLFGVGPYEESGLGQSFSDKDLQLLGSVS